MRIFSRREKPVPELLLAPIPKKRKYDFFAALAKALLLFLLVYGALGGFLSAFEIEYNKGICMLLLFGLAFLLSAIYETGKRWIINLAGIVLFVVYLYIALTNYWLINSGYYAVLNTIFEKARSYLGVTGGTEYNLAVQDPYLTVTVFVLFLGMVGIILLNIQLQEKSSLLKTVLLTLTPYVIPFYLERSPSLIYLLFLFTGYVAVAVLQGGNVKEHLSGQMRYVLPVAAVVAVLLVRVAAFVIPEEVYVQTVPASGWKTKSENQMKNLAQFGLAALFRRNESERGISGGQLGKGSAPIPTYETDLIVQYTPYDYNPVYLKAFTGKDYLGSSWTQAKDTASDDGMMLESCVSRKAAYERDPSRQGRGIMTVERAGASPNYTYRPYYSGDEDTRRYTRPGDDGMADIVEYTYYPAGGKFEMRADEADEGYLLVPESCAAAVQKICDSAGFEGDAEEIAEQVKAFFAENYSYTLRPGIYFGNPDYISHFLLENRKGYCAHFASAGTMLMRNMGIPARYVEGYVFSYLDVVLDGKLVMDAAYENYYNGYSPIGETGLIEMEIPDANAHAWVEIYVADKGWIVFDPTPSAAEEDDTSFWDAFMSRTGGESDINLGVGNAGAYLESVLNGASYVLLGIAALTFIVLLVARVVRGQREKRLPGRERVKLEYGRVKKCLEKKNRNCGALRTLREQLDWIRVYCGLEVTDEQEQALYQAFFAGRVDADCEKLCGELKELGRAVRFSRVKK